MTKPSPIASILLFVGAAACLFAAFSASWFISSGESYSSNFGLIRGSFCHDGDCESVTIFSGGGSLGLTGMISIFEFVLLLATAGLGATTGILLLKPGRRMLSIFTLCTAGLAILIQLGLFAKYGLGGGGHFGIGFYMFWLGALVSIVGCILAMVRPRAPGQGMPMRPMGHYPPGMYPQPGYAQHPGYPPQQGYAPAPMQQPLAPQAYSPLPQQQAQTPPPGAAPAGAPCPTCATPTQWVQQYNRWFCARCSRYV